MAEKQHQQIGFPVEGTITKVKGKCSWGHKVGDKLNLSVHDTAGLCGMFYHDLYPYITMLQLGGNYPWGKDPGVVALECMDRWNAVEITLRRIKP
ncbi:MAG: TIGR04076 family protein [Chloroflexi bacterium]|nr:TIGR04076 family protein [Chloroflexota bacterium]